LPSEFPSRARRALAIQCEIEQRRKDHAAQRRHDGKGRLAKGGQLALYNLTFDFKSDHQKKQRHQSIINPVMQIHG
jgi:hypothetical protein